MTPEELERRLVAWLDGREDVRAAAVLGSRARESRRADEWSDVDVLVIARDPDWLLRRGDWLDELGPVRITFVEPTATGDGLERRVLFDGGLDADFSIFSPEDVRTTGEQLDADVSDVLRRGIRVLLDRDGDLARLADAAAAVPEETGLPTAEQLAELVADFSYHAVWAAKKLRRGELFVAKAAVDSYMKRRLLTAVEWHARATRPGVDTWHGGRFLEEWADPRAVAALRDAFARYDEQDVRRALLATIELFRWVARETADSLGHPFPDDAERYAAQLVDHYLGWTTRPPAAAK